MKNVSFLVVMGFSFLIAHAQWQGPSVNFSHGRLKISENKRYLVFSDGTPFFYLGDTGWELFHRLTKQEAESYLEKRRSQGFTVIQAVVLAELDGLNTPNTEGNKPLLNNNPLTPDEKYFAHVDWVIRKAMEKGLFIGLLPTWGDKVDLASWGKGPLIFNKENAFLYGQWIGKRYRNFPNIIWINGGDRFGGGKNFEVFDALARGIKSVDTVHLMTFHPIGEHSSAEWFHESPWLDFNMTQTGHSQRSYAVYRWLFQPTYYKQPVKPCMDGEPRYEDHPVAWKPELFGWFDDVDVRQAAYWNLLSGACGHTYGCNSVWQFYDTGREPMGMARRSWKESLDLPGASQMIYVRKLFEKYPYTTLQPYQSLIANEYVPETDWIVAAVGKNFAFVYLPTGTTVHLKTNLLPWTGSKASWYNPRNGEMKEIEYFTHTENKTFTPPSSGRGNDWILILETK